MIAGLCPSDFRGELESKHQDRKQAPGESALAFITDIKELCSTETAISKRTSTTDSLIKFFGPNAT